MHHKVLVCNLINIFYDFPSQRVPTFLRTGKAQPIENVILQQWIIMLNLVRGESGCCGRILLCLQQCSLWWKKQKCSTLRENLKNYKFHNKLCLLPASWQFEKHSCRSREMEIVLILVEKKLKALSLSRLPFEFFSIFPTPADSLS